MVFEYELQTPRGGFIDITAQVSEAVAKFCEETGRTEALCLVFCPHTTAAVTVNENADPDVQHDLLIALEKAFPDRPEFLHSEGNSAAHAKSSCIGVSEQRTADCQRRFAAFGNVAGNLFLRIRRTAAEAVFCSGELR